MATMIAPHNATQPSGMRERLFAAWYLYQARSGGSKSQEWLAEAVSRKLGLREPLTQGTVSRWLKGSEPDLVTIAAIASVLGVDPGWLAFGQLTHAPPPRDPMQDAMRKLLLPED